MSSLKRIFKKEETFEFQITNLLSNKKLQKKFILSFMESLPLDVLKTISNFSKEETKDRLKTYFCIYTCDYLNSDDEKIK